MLTGHGPHALLETRLEGLRDVRVGFDDFVGLQKHMAFSMTRFLKMWLGRTVRSSKGRASSMLARVAWRSFSSTSTRSTVSCALATY